MVLDVVVRDKKGQMITDLTQEEFHVYENGEERLACLFSIPIEGLSPGTYQLRAWAQSGESVASESALFTIAE